MSSDKVDVIDLIINVLREHEKTLDELVGRLEEVLDRIPAAERGEVVERPPTIRVEVHDWREFRSRCRGAPVVAFEVEDRTLSIYAVKGGMIYTYSEVLPEMKVRMRKADGHYVVEEFSVDSLEGVPLAFRRRLSCGLEGSVKGSKIRVREGLHLINIAYDIDVEETKKWLSKELKVNKSNILRGKITI